MTDPRRNRQVLADLALALVPRMLTLQDRNPHSATYGCFDRNYWQYRIIDFPSGMAQELVWPLALAWSLEIPNNRFRGAPALKDWIVAGLDYARRASHPDGACDDYHPHEKATGAAAFSLLAFIEAYEILGLDDPGLAGFFERRARWLAGHRESGRLANHEALVLLSLLRLAALTGRDRGGDWEREIAARRERLLSWQSAEGWFAEYGGCDPGYLTLTVSLLARADALRPDLGLAEPLDRAARFAVQFAHPDGSYGGEYGSRNTLNFFPHGFELVGARLPEALAANDRILAAYARGGAPAFDDDHILGHHAWNYLLAWRDFRSERPAAAPPAAQGRRWYPEAGILIERRGARTLYAGLNKGGVFKLFDGERLVCSDTQVSARVRSSGGHARTAVAHLIDAYEIAFEDDTIVVAGRFGWARESRMTPLRMIQLRLWVMTVGRLRPDLTRRLLQALLITGKRAAPLGFRRRLAWRDGGLAVTDEVTAEDWGRIAAIGIGGYQTSIHVVMSRVFQAQQLQAPWLDLSGRLRGLEPGRPLMIERQL